MALIKCKECGKEVSDQATVCIHCGYELKQRVCPECGKGVSKGDAVCGYCGFHLVNKNDNYQKGNTYALVGMILGLCSIISWLLPLIGYPTTILGIIFSSFGLNSDKKAMAITGLALSIIFFIITLINSIVGAVMYS